MKTSILIEQPVLEKIYVHLHIDTDPDLSYLQQDYFNDDPKYPSCTMEENLKYKEQDAQLLRAYERGEWCMLGVVAVGNVHVTVNGLEFEHEFNASVWGVQSNDNDGIDMYIKEHIAEIKRDCKDKGVKVSKDLQVIIDRNFRD